VPSLRPNKRSAPSTWPLNVGLMAGGMALAFLVMMLPAPINYAASAAVIGLTVSAVLPIRALVFIWGALLPIWSVGTLNPLIFDALRFGLAGVIFIRSTKQHRNLWSKPASRIAIVLGAVGVIVGFIGLIRPESEAATTGLVMILGSVISYSVLSRSTEPWTLLNGYLAGTALSAIVLVLAGFGYQTITPLEFAGYARLSGLSPSATLVTYQMALGVVIAGAALGRKTMRPAYALIGLLSLFALLLSGGRGGIVALALVAVVAVRWRWIRPRYVVLGTIAVGGLLAYALSQGIALNTLDRLTEQTTGSEARTGLFEGALHAIASDPIIGIGYGAFEAAYGALPHVALQTFFIIGGVACGLPIIWVFLVLLRRVAAVDPRPFGPSGYAGHMMVAVLIAPVFLEPTGPFVGAAFVTLLLLALSLTEKQPDDDVATEQRTELEMASS